MDLQIIFWFIMLAVVLFFFAKSLKQALVVMGGHALYEVYNFFFDWIIWPTVQARGGWVGLIILTTVAWILNLTALWVYQKMGKDWLGVSVLEVMKIRAQELRWQAGKRGLWYQPIHWFITAVFKALMWLMRSDAFTFVFFSCHHDSLVATVFLRKGRRGPITGRDLVVFTASTLFSCAFWALVSGCFIIPSVTNVWQTIVK